RLRIDHSPGGHGPVLPRPVDQRRLERRGVVAEQGALQLVRGGIGVAHRDLVSRAGSRESTATLVCSPERYGGRMAGIVSLLPSATATAFGPGRGHRPPGRPHGGHLPPGAAGGAAPREGRLGHGPLDSAGIGAQGAPAGVNDGLYRPDEEALAAAAPELI